MSWRRLWAVMLKELRQLRRDRITLAMIVGIPVMQLVLFGYAINLNLRGLDAAIADQAGTAGSRALVMDMLATGVIAPVREARTPQELMEMLQRGEISVGIAIPPDFERRRIDGRQVAQVLVDGSDTVVQSAAVQLAQVPVDTKPVANAGYGAAQPAVRAGPIDVVMTDLRMPVMDGNALIRELRRQSRLPIIVMTETPEHDGLLMASQLGIQEVIPRPKVPLARILGYVRQHLHRAVSNEGTLVAWA